jgi:hypothetical protein
MICRSTMSALRTPAQNDPAYLECLAAVKTARACAGTALAERCAGRLDSFQRGDTQHFALQSSRERRPAGLGEALTGEDVMKFKSLFNPEFKYRSAVKTDVRKTFRRIKREQKKSQREAEAKLTEGSLRQRLQRE